MEPKKSLPLLEARRAELETCGYCPKLCRTACPVSEAQPREALTPWGKMSSSWNVLEGRTPARPEEAMLAYACTSCGACRDYCEHRNPVSDTLQAARFDHFRVGTAPAVAVRSARRHVDRVLEAQDAIATLRALPRVEPNAETALLVGCGYLRHAPEVARDIVAATVRLAGTVRLLDGCCGAALRDAGDRDGFEEAQRRLRATLRGVPRVYVADPSCALTLADESRVRPLVELFAERKTWLTPVATNAASYRLHVPCTIARRPNLRSALEQVFARAVAAKAALRFPRETYRSVCSGGGGLLPLTHPQASEAMAKSLLEEHTALGPGVIVTACAGSLQRFAKLGAPVLDIATLSLRAMS